MEGMDPLSNSDVQELVGLVEETFRSDFAPREYHYQHVMNIFGQVLVMRMMKLVLSLQQLQFITKFLKYLQTTEGGFSSTFHGETDARTTYAALATIYSANLQIEFIPEIQKASQYIMNQMNYLGGFGLAEAHLAYTYCGVAALRLAEQMLNYTLITDDVKKAVTSFVANRQTVHGGFNGRPNKHVDGCYSFWAVGCLSLLGKTNLNVVNEDELMKFVHNCCQDENGCGLRDKPDTDPDSYHCCYVLGGVAVKMGVVGAVTLGFDVTE